MIKETQKEDLCESLTCFKWCKRFEENVDLILDDTGRGSKPSVTEKTLTLISDPMYEDRLLILLHSVIRDSIRMCTKDEIHQYRQSIAVLGRIL